MAKKALRNKQEAQAKFKVREYTRSIPSPSSAKSLT